MFYTLANSSFGWSSVQLHVFVEPYRPPIPELFYLAGSAAAVLVSFVLAGLFAKSNQGYRNYPRIRLHAWEAGEPRLRVWVVQFLELCSFLLFALVIATGFFGNSHPLHNFSPTFVWVIWWVGVAYASAFIGDIWYIVNPWKITFGWAETIWIRLGFNRAFGLSVPYPVWLGVWPAVILFLCFAWLENVYQEAVIPSRISQMILAYSVITWSGMFIFGKDIWLRRGEAFSLAFGFLSRFAPTEIRLKRHQLPRSNMNRTRTEDVVLEPIREPTDKVGELMVRPFGAGLLKAEPGSSSHMVFVLLLLATVTFDGLTATSLWPAIQTNMGGWLPGMTAVGTFGLTVAILLFIGCYVAVSALMSFAAGRELGVREIANAFVYTLIPIALAYHLAHFLLFLLVQGQLIIPLASDPFGSGWDLLGTATYRVNFNLVGPNAYWFTSVIGIVVGHIAAVFLAHNTALQLIRSRRLALRSQYPMLVLMVVYTVASLWIITQPMTMSAM